MARFLLDENVPHIFLEVLGRAGHDVVASQQVGLAAASDETVFEYAQRIEATVISQDLDFSDLRNFPVGNHFGIIVLRLKDLPPREMAARTLDAITHEIREALYGSLVIIDRRQSRQTSA